MLILLLVVAVAARAPVLGTIPIGIQADEGDRANWALRVIDGLAPRSWFEDGWYLINLVYFRLLAASMEIFGKSVAGTRALSAIVGSLLVATIAYIGCRNFGWRVGLLATAIAATGALFVQQKSLRRRVRADRVALGAVGWPVSSRGGEPAARWDLPWPGWRAGFQSISIRLPGSGSRVGRQL